jgi:putative transposase
MRCLHEAWRTARERYPFTTQALCLLPDHLHCIWSLPDDDDDYSTRWGFIKGVFSRRYVEFGGADGHRSESRRKRGEAGLWQRRFWEHRIRDPGDFRRHVDYIHFNPVRHGYVSSAREWPWSTLHRHVRAGFYDPEWGTVEPDLIETLITTGE